MKMKFKRGIVAGALAMAFAFTSPFWVGCDTKKTDDTQTTNTTTTAKTNKEVASTVISNAKTTVTKMFSDAQKQQSASNSASTAPVLAAENTPDALSSGIRKFNKLSFKGLNAFYPVLVQIDNSLALEIADALVQNENYELGSVFTGTMNFTVDKSQYPAIQQILPNEYANTTIKGKINLDTNNKKLEFQASIVNIHDSNEYVTYLYAVLGYDNDKKITSYQTNYSTPSENSMDVFYSEGVDLDSFKSTYITRKYNNGEQSKTVTSDGSTLVEALSNEIDYVDSLKTAYNALKALNGTNVESLADAVKAALKTTNDIFTVD